MKRKSKNLISVIIILLLCGAMALTGYLAINKSSGNKDNQMSNMNQNNGMPPEIPNNNGQNQGSPPLRPDGNNNMGTPPSKPDGDNSMGAPPDMPNGNGQNPMEYNTSSDYVYIIAFGIESLILSSLILYLLMSKFNEKTLKETLSTNNEKIMYLLGIIILTSGLTFGTNTITSKLNKPNNINNQNMPNIPGGQNTNISYSSSNEIKESTTETSGEYDSTKADENALLVSGDIDANLSNINVSKSGDSDGGDTTSFYGTNSAILAKDGANLTLKNITAYTNATGANGVFSYGGSATTNNSSNDGTTINISDSKITTTKDNSGGIMTTGGGIMNASNLTIETAGTSSAAIRSDRGGGTVNVDGGTYKTTGQGSPSIYSTSDTTVKNAKLIATASEGVVIEGKNKVSLENVTLTDTNNTLNGQSTTYKNIFLYQSMSGDAAHGVSEFNAKNSTITTNKGDTLYITNTSSKITLTNNKIINNDSTGNFLRAQKDSWGNSGSNGGIVELTMSNQEAKGNIVIDSVSTLDMTMKNNSYYEGTINEDNSAKSIKLTLDKTSKIKLTGDSYITSLDNKDLSNSNIDFNGYKLYVNGNAIN